VDNPQIKQRAVLGIFLVGVSQFNFSAEKEKNKPLESQRCMHPSNLIDHNHFQVQNEGVNRLMQGKTPENKYSPVCIL